MAMMKQVQGRQKKSLEDIRACEERQERLALLMQLMILQQLMAVQMEQNIRSLSETKHHRCNFARSEVT